MTAPLLRDRDAEVRKMVLSLPSSQCSERDIMQRGASPKQGTAPQWGEAKHRILEEAGSSQQRLHQGQDAPVEMKDDFPKQIKS